VYTKLSHFAEKLKLDGGGGGAPSQCWIHTTPHFLLRLFSRYVTCVTLNANAA
jgi:hypothetical protein